MESVAQPHNHSIPERLVGIYWEFTGMGDCRTRGEVQMHPTGVHLLLGRVDGQKEGLTLPSRGKVWWLI